jgi:hypothetical protein
MATCGGLMIGAYSAAFLRKVKQTLEGRDWAADLTRRP